MALILSFNLESGLAVERPNSQPIPPPRPPPGVHGLCASPPGAQPADADGAEGLRGPGPEPPGEQPVEGLLLVRRQPAGDALRGLHTGRVESGGPARRGGYVLTPV